MMTRTTRRTSVLGLMTLIAIFAVGCSGGSDDQAAADIQPQAETQEPAVTLTEAQEAMVAEVAAIAVAVEKAPAMAEAILKDAGVTLEQYEAMAYEIAASPTLSAAFEKAKAGL